MWVFLSKPFPFCNFLPATFQFHGTPLLILRPEFWGFHYLSLLYVSLTGASRSRRSERKKITGNLTLSLRTRALWLAVVWFLRLLLPPRSNWLRLGHKWMEGKRKRTLVPRISILCLSFGNFFFCFVSWTKGLPLQLFLYFGGQIWISRFFPPALQSDERSEGIKRSIYQQFGGTLNSDLLPQAACCLLFIFLE